jgi:hypothetical protein
MQPVGENLSGTISVSHDGQSAMSSQQICQRGSVHDIVSAA